MNRQRFALVATLIIAMQGLSSAEDAEFAKVVRNGDTATLRVFGARPVDLAARKLVNDFALAVNVEDPFYMNLQDLEEVKPPRPAGSGNRLLTPKPSALELRLDLNADGSLRDPRKVVKDLVDTANAKLPFQYRVDTDGTIFTLVATRTRDDRGRSVELNPMLDRQVTVPLGTRTILDHVRLLTEALGEQTGFHFDCCDTAAGASGWGTNIISFEAREQMARSVLLQLIRNAPAAPQQASRESGRYSWKMRCQPRESSCLIDVAPLVDRH